MQDDEARSLADRNERKIRARLIPDPHKVSCNYCKQHWQLCRNGCSGFRKAKGYE